MNNLEIKAPESGNFITEKMYPMTALWIFKAPIIIIFISIVALFLDIWFPYLIILIPVYLVINPLKKRNFHFLIGEDSLQISSGIISKEEKTIPYGEIKDILVKRDVFDYIFGLSGLVVDDSEAVDESEEKGRFSKLSLPRNIGSKSSKNKAVFSGLKKRDAEILRDVLLKKINDKGVVIGINDTIL